jgi:arsenite methyltransferase
MGVYQTSIGHNFCTSEWLDIHYEAAKPEYESMLDLVGIKSGWHVLDAGCGNGNFINFIDRRVEQNGQISALDLAPENINIVKEKIGTATFSSKVTAHIGNVVSLPFKDNTFDAVWCAAVTQLYLTEEEVVKAMNEFKRVVKPGGVIAIKQYDGISSFYYPTPDITLLWKSIDVMDAYDKERWFVRPLEMQNFFKRNGLMDVMQKTILIERREPLNKPTKRYLEELIRVEEISWAKIEFLSKRDQKKWHSAFSKTSREYILNKDNFYWREGHVVTIGKVL